MTETQNQKNTDVSLRDDDPDPSMDRAMAALDEMAPTVDQIMDGDGEMDRDRVVQLVLLLEQFRPLVKNLIHQNQKLEREVRQKNRLKVLGEMASCLAHEIRTPLASVHLNLDRLKERTEDDPETRRLVEKISSGLEKTQNMVDDILTYSREIEPVKQRFSWSDMIDGVLRDLEAKIEKYDTTVNKFLEEDLPAVKGDPQKLARVHENVILNAIQSAGENGTVRIRCSHRNHDRGDETVPVVQTDVLDDGPGIPEEIKDQLFTPFHSNKTRGTGLGLAIASRIVKAHEGQITGENQDEGGAKFSIQVPVQFQNNASKDE